jgi:hypothetical protein
MVIYSHERPTGFYIFTLDSSLVFARQHIDLEVLVQDSQSIFPASPDIIGGGCDCESSVRIFQFDSITELRVEKPFLPLYDAIQLDTGA